MEASALEQVLPGAIARAENIPTLPMVAREVLRLADDPNASVSDFAEAITTDPTLAAKLLKLSNSSLFGLGQQVTSLPVAASLLGLKTVQLMALSFSLVSSQNDAKVAGLFSYREYWRRSLCAAIAAREFARIVTPRVTNEAFLCGLLSHLGCLVMARCIPDEYQQVLERSDGWPSVELEREILGFDHSSVGSGILEAWGIPLALCLPVAHWTDPTCLSDEATAETRSLTWIVRMAGLSAQVLCDPSKGRALNDLHAIAEADGLSRGQVDTCLLTLESRIRETAALLELDCLGGDSHYEILAEARDQMMRIGLGAVAELKQTERRASHLEAKNRSLIRLANTDSLTSLYNRQHFDTILAKEFRARISGVVPGAIGLLMIDIDHFKEINDRYGHQEGDEILRGLGQALKGLTRRADIPARYGGDEFAVIAPSINIPGLQIFGGRLQAAIADLTISGEKSTHSLTISIGGACMSSPTSMSDSKRLIQAADEALYQAKEKGRNCCEIYPQEL